MSDRAVRNVGGAGGKFDIDLGRGDVEESDVAGGRLDRDSDVVEVGDSDLGGKRLNLNLSERRRARDKDQEALGDALESRIGERERLGETDAECSAFDPIAHTSGVVGAGVEFGAAEFGTIVRADDDRVETPVDVEFRDRGRRSDITDRITLGMVVT